MKNHFRDRNKRLITLRRAVPEDAPAIAKVHVDSWHAAYRGLVPDSFLEEFTYEKREAAFRDALIRKTEETYLAEEDGEPIGILTIGAGRDPDLNLALTGELWGIYLVPACWRRGIGTWLAGEAERVLHMRGFQDIVLWVLEGNAAARRFYEDLGFLPDGRSRMLELGKPLSAVRYRKSLEKRRKAKHKQE